MKSKINMFQKMMIQVIQMIQIIQVEKPTYSADWIIVRLILILGLDPMFKFQA